MRDLRRAGRARIRRPLIARRRGDRGRLRSKRRIPRGTTRNRAAARGPRTSAPSVCRITTSWTRPGTGRQKTTSTNNAGTKRGRPGDPSGAAPDRFRLNPSSRRFRRYTRPPYEFSGIGCLSQNGAAFRGKPRPPRSILSLVRAVLRNRHCLDFNLLICTSCILFIHTYQGIDVKSVLDRRKSDFSKKKIHTSFYSNSLF